MNDDGRVSELTAVERQALSMLGRRLARLADELDGAEEAAESWRIQTRAAAELCTVIEAAAREREAVLGSGRH